LTILLLQAAVAEALVLVAVAVALVDFVLLSQQLVVVVL
jgi:hypothetical protein